MTSGSAAVRKPESGSASSGYSNDSAQANSAPISSVVAHDPLRDHEPAERDVLLHRTGRAHADDVLHADVVEFLNTDASRRRPDARRHRQDPLPAVRADDRLVFAVESPRLRVIHELRNRIHPCRISHDDCPVRPNRMRQLCMRLRSLNFPFLVHKNAPLYKTYHLYDRTNALSVLLYYRHEQVTTYCIVCGKHNIPIVGTL